MIAGGSIRDAYTESKITIRYDPSDELYGLEMYQENDESTYTVWFSEEEFNSFIDMPILR